MTWLAFLAAAAIGAPLRHVVSTTVQRRVAGDFPSGTLVVNASGSLVLGVLVGLAIAQPASDAWLLALGTGFCGAYTTFSAFTLEAVRLFHDRAVVTAVRYIAATVILCVAAAAAGLAMV